MSMIIVFKRTVLITQWRRSEGLDRNETFRSRGRSTTTLSLHSLPCNSCLPLGWPTSWGATFTSSNNQPQSPPQSPRGWHTLAQSTSACEGHAAQLGCKHSGRASSSPCQPWHWPGHLCLLGREVRGHMLADTKVAVPALQIPQIPDKTPRIPGELNSISQPAAPAAARNTHVYCLSLTTVQLLPQLGIWAHKDEVYLYQEIPAARFLLH